jgi:hypothetical protein
MGMKHKNSKMADSKKKEFFKTPNSQYFFLKNSEIDPWVSRINFCEGHQCGSTYMIVRLSDKRSKTGKKHKKCYFCLFYNLRWMA